MKINSTQNECLQLKEMKNSSLSAVWESSTVCFFGVTSKLAKRLFTFLLVMWLAIFLPSLAPAAAITWGAATGISGDADIITNGTTLYAYAGGLTTASTNLNGVTFTQGSGFAAWGSVSFTSGFTASSGTGYAVAAAPFNGLSSAYQAVLQGAASGGTTAGTVTLNGLTLGKSYAIQIWLNDSRSGATATRAENASSTGGNTVNLTYNSFQALGGVGQYVYGTFVADNTNQVFTLTPNPSTGGSAQLNAISVRDLGSSTKTWLGSSSMSWGTSANWNPSGAPISGNSVLFNNTSVANLSTVLDADYNLAALMVSNNASPIAIGGANTLTLNSASGITLVGSSQNLTITAPIVLGANQYWTLTNNSSVVASGGISGSGSFALNGGFGVTNNGGTVTFSGPQSFTGNCDVNSGKLVLTGSASLATPSLRVNSGSTLDVSAVGPTFTLNSGQVLTGFGSLGSILNGSIDCSSATLALRYDGVTPMFYLTNGTMTLTGSTVLSINNIGPTLVTGTYNIISAATSGNIGQVTGALPSFNLTGNGAVGAVSIQLSGTGDLQLVVAPADVWTGASDSSWANAANWNPNVVPNPADYVLFNNSSTAHLSTVLNADFFLSGVSVINPSGAVSISGANNLGIGASGINLAAATQNLTVAAPMQVLADQSWIVTNARTLTVSGGVSGSGNLTVSGGGKVALNSVATHTGNTTVAASGTLQTTAANVLPAGAGVGNVVVNGTLDMNGNSQAMNGLSGSGVVDSLVAGSPVLTVGNNDISSTFSGIIQNTGGALSLVKTGTGSLTLNGTNTYSGGTVLNQGTIFPSNGSSLGSGAVSAISGSSKFYVVVNATFTNALTIDGAIFEIGGSANHLATWSGPTTITANGVTLSEDGGATGVNLAGPVNFGSGGTVVTNAGNGGVGFGSGANMISGTISGSGGITYFGSGVNSRLTLTGTNIYTGGTVVNGSSGKINIYSAGSTNYAFSTGTVTLNAGGLIESYPGNAIITNALTLNGGTLESESQFNNFNTLTWAGPVTVTADSTLFQWGAVNTQQSSGVAVTGPLNMNNSGYTLNSSGSSALFGGNTINGQISGSGNIQVTMNALTLGGSNTFSGTFRSVAGTLIVNNSYALQNATLDMNAADSGSVTLNNLNAVIGALTGFRNLALGSGVVTVGNNNASTTYSAVLSGLGSLIKTGSGTLILSGTNTYTGSTTVNGGTLVVQQPTFAFNNSAVTVAGGAVLQLNFSTTNVVSALVLNGVSQPNGVYKSSNSGGRITGTGSIQVGVTPQIWTGALSSEWSINNLSAPKNWKFNTAQTNYTDGSVVLFDDTLTANNLVNLSVANVTPSLVTFNNNNTNYTVQGTAAITGSAALSKSGNATITLLNSNFFTGGVAINAGKLAISGNGALGVGRTNAAPIVIANGATFEYSGTNSAGHTFSGPITGAGAVLFSSTNVSTLALTAGANANTYGGITTISNANNTSIRINATTLGSISPNTTFNIAGSSTSGGQLLINVAGTFANNFNISGVGYAETTGNGGGIDGAIRLVNNDILSGTINLTGNSRVGSYLNAAGFLSATISGQITGNYSMDFYGLYGAASGVTGTNIFTLANTGTVNNYTGNTYIYNQYFNGSSGPNNTILKLGANEQIPNGAGKGALVFTGNAANRLCTLELNGFNETVNGITNTTAGAFSIIQNTTIGASVLTVGDGNTASTFSGNILDGGAGKTLAITKIGLGTLTLSGTNTYNGGTTISGGTLLVNLTTNGTGAGAVNINSGGTLGGSGNIVGLVNNNAGGVLSPGVGGVGKLALNGNVTLQSGSTNLFVVNGSTPTNNSVSVGATVTYGGVLNIVTNGIFTVGQKFNLFNGTGATNTSNFASVIGSPGAGMAFSFTNGVLSVVASGPLPPAVINSVTVSGSSLILQGTNGASSGTYSILTSTNLSLPLVSWSTNTSGTFTAGGVFSNSVPITSQAQRYFLIKQP